MKPLKTTMVAFFAAATLASCSKSDDGPSVPENRGNYILTVTPASGESEADYLLTAASLESGKVSTAGNGIEQDGTYRYYVTHNNKFFSMLYGQGNPGAVTAYDLHDGLLNKLTNFQTETVQAFEPVNDDLLLYKISRNPENPLSNWYKVNTNSLLITSEGTTNTLELAGNGELAFFSWLKQVGDKVYAPYFCIQDNSFATHYPDSAWIAVFNYADMSVEKVIKSDRTSAIGRYFRDGLALTENGDLYGFSSSIATDGEAFNSTKPSAIVKIDTEKEEFDPSYYFNFEEASGGLNITTWLYLGNDNFIVLATTKEEKAAYDDGKHIGILNVADKTFKSVSGLPDAASIESVTYNNYTPKDGKTGYIGVNLVDGTSWVYKIDASTLTATPGLQVEGGRLTAIQYLP